MSNIMNLKSIRNKPSRNGYDLSYRNSTTCKTGQVEVLSCKPCYYGEEFDINFRWFTRTRPANTSAFTRIKEHVNWYFVPYNQLWNKFDTWFSQMKDNNYHASSLTSIDVLTSDMPYITEQQISDYIRYHSKTFNDSNGTYSSNMFGFNRAELSCKLLHSLGYGDYYKSLTNDLTYPSPRKLNPFRLLGYNKIYYDYIRNSQWEKNFAPAYNIDYIKGTADNLQLPIDAYDMRSNYTMFDVRYCDWPKDYFMGLVPNAQYGEGASVNVNLDDIVLQFTGETGGFDAGASNIMVTGSPLSSAQNIVLNANSLLPTTSNNNQQLKLTLSNSDVARLRTALGMSSGSGTSINSTFSVLALRMAEAMQKLKEIQQSTSQDSKSQAEAIWDVTISDARSETCKWLGGFTSMLEFTEQVNTNLADNNKAIIRGKGVGTGQDSVHFRTEVPGMLYCIYTAQPMLDYALSGIDHDALRTNIMDMPNPVLDKTGMVSIPAIELTRYELSADRLLGYAPRYADLKTSIDQVHGAFYNGSEDDKAWVAPVSDEYIRAYIDSQGIGTNDEILNYIFMKVNPSTLNPIFDLDADSSVTSDQLKVQIAFNYKAVRPYDRNGLPY